MRNIAAYSDIRTIGAATSTSHHAASSIRDPQRYLHNYGGRQFELREAERISRELKLFSMDVDKAIEENKGYLGTDVLPMLYVERSNRTSSRIIALMKKVMSDDVVNDVTNYDSPCTEESEACRWVMEDREEARRNGGRVVHLAIALWEEYEQITARLDKFRDLFD
jgi:hypothetical protein